MGFDITDPYQAADCWITLTCDECGQWMECEAAEGVGYPEEYRIRGIHAKQTGWYVVDKSKAKVNYQVYCPRCVAAKGLKLPSPDLRLQPPNNVGTVLGLDLLGQSEAST